MPGTADALRLGWTLAEARGLSNPRGPRPEVPDLPAEPEGLLPLRSERPEPMARDACVGALLHLAEVMRVDSHQFASRLDEVVAGASTPDSWTDHRTFFQDFDRRVQNELTLRDEQLANAYLLGRGLAECYWATEPGAGETGSAHGVGFLLGPARRRELTRMLGRLEAGHVHSLTPAVVSGSLEAWGRVLADPDWARFPSLQASLYEQVRRWYQLVVLRQDPTTLVLPYSRLSGVRHLARNLRVIWPQALLAVLAVAAATWVIRLLGGADPHWPQSLLASGSAWLVIVGGLLARGRNAAQLWATRLRQDAYTDLIAIDMTFVPDPPPGTDPRWLRVRRARVESAVRRRRLTPATPAPDAVA